MRRSFLLLLLTLSVLAAQPTDARDRKVRAEFQRLNPCPANNERRGPCPGYVVDHIAPLCAGGPDAVGNMQWQEILAAQEKDTAERADCNKALKHSTP